MESYVQHGGFAELRIAENTVSSLMECFLHCCDDTHDPVPLPDGQDVTVGRKPELKIRNSKCSRNQVQLTADYAKKEVKIKQLGKIPSLVGARELNKGGTALLGPGGKICLLRQEYPHFVYFKTTSTVQKYPAKSSCDSGHNKNSIDGSKTDNNISKKRRREECDSDDKSYSGSKYLVMKKAKTHSEDSIDGSKTDNNISKKRRREECDGEDKSNGGSEYLVMKKAKTHHSEDTCSIDGSKTHNNISRKRRREECDSVDNNGSDDGEYKVTKKAKSLAANSVKLENARDTELTDKETKDTKDVDDPVRLESSTPCASSTWEEIPQELLIYTRKGVDGRSKIAGFDMDGTLITTKSGKVFPTNTADWKIALPQIPERLKKLWNDGYKNGIAKKKVSVPDFKKKIENVVGSLSVPIQVLISPGTGCYRKPSTGMWNHLCKKLNQGIDVSEEKSFYIGDAAGRPVGWAPGKKKDFSCSDRAFAVNIGIKFETPEEFFLGKKPAPFNMPVFDPKTLDDNRPLYTPTTATLVAKEQEVIVMVGFPAAGKSTFCLDHLVPHGYVRVNRDTLGTWQRCVTACRNALAEGKKVVIDNTNPDKESRKRFIECGRAAKVPVRCFLMDVSVEHAKHNNVVRETVNTDKNYKHVSAMVFNMYKSSYKEPSCDEGFKEILQIHFRPKFKDKNTRDFYYQFL